MKSVSRLFILVLVLVLSSVMLVGCAPSHKAKSIEFTMLSNDEFNKMHLEEKSASKLTFIENGSSDYVIVHIDGESKALDRAVGELRDIIKEMTGVELAISRTKVADKKALYIHNTSEVALDDIKWDGFVIDIGEDIAIRGRDVLSSHNGIYYFIEEYLGAVFVSPYDTYIPHHDNIYLDKGTKTVNPATEWRDISSIDIGDNYWAARLKLNSIDVERTDDEVIAELEAQGFKITPENRRFMILSNGRQHIDWQYWCHSYYDYVSPDEYFETHPEYFSMKGGKRMHEYNGIDAQLCLSNPEVYDIVETEMLRLVAANPDKKYFDFSCNDNYPVKGCKCRECKKLDKAAGGTGMGSLLPVLNKLARKVREVYPDREVYISTLAYFHTLKAPKGIKAEPNVVIKLCSMPGDQGTSYLDPGNYKAQEFHDMINEWKDVTDKIVVWDYVVNFKNLLVPFPNFAVQRDNQQFFEENNVQGLFHQGSRDDGGESVIMRDYILAKLMWQGSSMDVAREVSRFIMAYYGDAAPEVIEYYNAQAANLAKSSSTLGLYDNNMSHFFGYLSKGNVRYYEDVINRAYAKVKGNTEIESRLDYLRLNVAYAKMLLPNISISERNEAKATFDTLVDEKNITMIEELSNLEKFNAKYSLKVTVNVLIMLSPLILVILIALIVGTVILVKRHKNRRQHQVE